MLEPDTSLPISHGSTDVDTTLLVQAVEMCYYHRQGCKACLVAELCGEPYCELYDHMAMHAMAYLDDELYPPQDVK